MNVFERREDFRLLKGEGRFVDDDHSADHLHLVFVRSHYAHAHIKSIDLAAALAQEGVVTAFTGADVKAIVANPFQQFSQGPLGPIVDYGMAVDTVHFQGEPVVGIVARTAEIGLDAASLVKVDYEPLPAVIDAEEALSDKFILHASSGSNLVWKSESDWGDVDAAFASAATIIEIDKLYFHRFSSTPLECYAVVARWDQDGIDFLTGLLQPGFTQLTVAPVLGVAPDSIRIRTRDVGGSFGVKQHVYPYLVLAAIASRKVGGRSVKWIETRSEHLAASAHGSDRTFLDTRVALDADGVILGIESTHVDDCGGYPRYEPLGGVIWTQVASGNYRMQNMRIHFKQVTTSKCPSGPNRGYSRMQHIWFLERVVDICGHKLGIEADEIRRRNYVQKMPYTTLNGCVYDSGDYAQMLASAQALVGWDEWREKCAAMRADGKIIGIGIGTTLDSGTNNFGQSKLVTPYAPFTGNAGGAGLRVDGSGTVIVAMGSVPQGQSHETIAAEVVSKELGIPLGAVRVESGFDTQRGVHTTYSGTYASQFVVTTLSAVHGAVEKLRAELLAVAAAVSGLSADELRIGTHEGRAVVMNGDASVALGFDMLWMKLNFDAAELPDEVSALTLDCKYVYRPKFGEIDLEKRYGNLTLTYAAQLHIGVIEIDPLSHSVRILDYVAIDDCGRVLNHTIVQGQVNGAVAHGLGAALMENLRYDENGNLLTATFSDYTPITMMNMPRIKYGRIESPSPFTYNGAKGMGEGGGAAVHTICAALQDALAGAGYTIQNSHYSPSELYELISSDPEPVVHKLAVAG